MQLRISPKNSSNLRVELDGICRGTLPTRVLLPLFPTNFEGKITAEQASELLQIMRKQAFSILVDYLAKAEHSSQQCRNLLQRKEYHAQIIEEALERCRSLNYLDDSRFSEVLINSYVTRKASKRAIIAKLREQQISPDIWEPLLEELYPRQQAAQNIGDLLFKYCASHRDLPRPKLKERAFGYLFRRGFDLSDIQSAWEELA